MELFILTTPVLRMWTCFSWSKRTSSLLRFWSYRYFLLGWHCLASSAVKFGWRSKPIV